MTAYYVSQDGGSGAHDGLTVNTAWSVGDLAADGTKWHAMRGSGNIVHIMGNITSRLYVICNTGVTSWNDRLLISGLTYSGRVVVSNASACVIDQGTGGHYIQIEDLYLESTVASTGTGMHMFSTPATGENRFYRLTINNCVRNGFRIAKDNVSTLCKADIRDCVITNSGDDNIFIQEIILTNNIGCILDIVGDADIIKIMEGGGAGLGSILAEERIGTTSIGLALTERMPVQVAGHEHFVRQFHIATGAAAPIFDITGHLLGSWGW